ncbi:conserved hypothetical protein [Lodderomyces elongisporus NRRL YB-4239]|uniref:RRM domain-containing protein n=1 Tax=Lodderomyces elongisporus (strain ATCC 11503 / CBS 2605 / JCM 1781 / NBRC 1676 / NRRL YB-4239) TaxID=379508 RepID=A5DY14_LODEL|nr:conserved hypothetical protein [Lodderomyces elongisporus NRRL YB-4239]
MHFPIVLVKNLSFTASNKSIYDFFSQYGHIYQVRTSTKEQHQGQVFIIYDNIQSAERAAKEANGVNFQGRYLVTSIYQVDKSKIDQKVMTLKQEQIEELKQLYDI